MPDQKLPFTVIEKMLPGRINTKAIASWEGEHGYLCVGCEVVGPIFYSKCNCDDWNAAIDRMQAKITKQIKGRNSND
jgi:hypothetical protein